jgi:hypothetical protein
MAIAVDACGRAQSRGPASRLRLRRSAAFAASRPAAAEQDATAMLPLFRMAPVILVCTENLVRIDLERESRTSTAIVALRCSFLTLLTSPFRPMSRLEAENAALRHRWIVLRRELGGPVQFTNGDRLFFILLYRWFRRSGCRVVVSNQREALGSRYAFGSTYSSTRNGCSMCNPQLAAGCIGSPYAKSRRRPRSRGAYSNTVGSEQAKNSRPSWNSILCEARPDDSTGFLSDQRQAPPRNCVSSGKTITSAQRFASVFAAARRRLPHRIEVTT